MHLYRIPRLYCPFPAVPYPDIQPIEEHTLQWLVDFRLITTPDKLEHYRQQGFAAMIAYSYPFGDEADLCAWCDMNTLLFLLDDLLDEENFTKDKMALKQLEESFLDVLEKGRRCSLEKDGPFLTALAEFWQRMEHRSSNVWKHKFIRSIKDMFNAAAWQFAHGMEKRRPDLGEYVQYRQYLGAANVATESLEVTGRVLLQESVYRTPMVIRLTELARNAVCFANDLFSLGKEIARSEGAEFNLVTILGRTCALTTEGAIQTAAAIHDAYVREFLDLSERAFIYDEPTNRMLDRYIQCLVHFMKGNIEWSTRASTRYPHIYEGVEQANREEKVFA